ncbi:polyprotein [Sapovirus GVII/RV0042]|nr:polyprotein [Sapovirus GVII/RV0042]
MAAVCRHSVCARFQRESRLCAEVGVLPPDNTGWHSHLHLTPRGPIIGYRLQGLFDCAPVDCGNGKNNYNLPTTNDPVGFVTQLLSDHTREVCGPITTGTIHALRQVVVDALLRQTGPLYGKLETTQLNALMAALTILTPTPTNILDSRLELEAALRSQTCTNLRAAITAGILKGSDVMRETGHWVKQLFHAGVGGFTKIFKLWCHGVAAYFDNAANGAITITSLLSTIKPVVLSMIIRSHQNTPHGWIVTLTALRELYGFDTSDIGALITQIIDALTSLAHAAWSKILSAAGYTMQGVDTTAFACVVLGAIYYLCTGNVWKKDVMSRLRNIMGVTVSIIGFVRAIQYMHECIQRDVNNRNVTKFLVRVGAFIDATKVKDLKASEAENIMEFADTLMVEGQELLVSNIGPLVSVIQNTLRDVANHKVALQSLVASAQRVQPPVMYVFCGPPGIGKTTLINGLVKALGQKSTNFTLMLDHHDYYTGETVALWDEYDTDPKGAYISTVIGMINTVPLPLNCDRIENKGRVFSSHIVLATTNNETPIQPNDPRYSAFMRRITIIDVSCPKVTECIEGGRRPNPGMFKPDFSHLDLRRRCHMAYTKEGHLPNGKQFGSTPITFSKLVADLQAELAGFALQGPEWEGLWVRCVKSHHVPEVTDYFNAMFKWIGVPTRVITDRTGSEVGFYDCVVTDRHPPQGSKYHEIVVDGFRVRPDCVRDPYERPLSIFDFVGTPSQNLINMAIRHTRGHVVVTSTGPVDCSRLPRPRRVVDASNWFQLIKAAFAHSSLFTPFALWRMVKNGATLTQDNIEEFFKNVTKDVKFGPNPECTLIRLPMLDVLFFTCSGSYTWILPGRMPLVHLGPIQELLVPSSSVVRCTLPQAIHLAVTSFVNYIKPYIGVVMTTVSLSHIWSDSLQKKKGKNKRGGFRALGDEEYQEYLDLQRDWRLKMTVDEYIDIVSNPESDYVERYNAWANLRQLRMANGAYDHARVVIGKSGPRWEIQGPTPTVTLNDTSGQSVGFANRIGEGLYVTCTHLLDHASSVDGVPFEQVTAVADCAVIRQTIPTSGPCYKVSTTTDPATFDTNKAPITCLHKAQQTVGGSVISGWRVSSQVQTKSGDCGKPYFDASGCLVGVHSASANVGPYKLVSRVCTTVTARTQPDLKWKGLDADHTTANMGPLTGSTKYHKSLAYYDCGYEPANFGPNDQRCPIPLPDVIATQVRPYQDPPVAINGELLHRGKRHVQAFLRHILGTHRRKPLPLVEAFKSLNMKSSNGPWFPGVKKDYTTEDGGPNPILENYIVSKFNDMTHGRYKHCYRLALKDELRPTQKVREGKRRLLWGCDVALATGAAMVYKNLFDDIARAAPCAGSCVGIDMDNVDTIKLLNQMFTGFHTVCADYSQWDSTLHPEVITTAIDILGEFIEPTDFASTIQSVLKQRPAGLVFDISLPTLKGLPSGMPGTSVFNSVCHLVLFACCVLQCYAERGIPYQGNVFANERIVVYGDDCIYGWTPGTASMAPRFWDHMRAFGMRPTNTDKTGDPAFTSTLQFLKRTIVGGPNGTLLGALDKSSLERQLCWIKGPQTTTMEPIYPPDPVARLAQIQNAVWRSAAWGPEYFQHFEHLAANLARCEHLPYTGTEYSEAIEVITNISSGTPEGEAIVYKMEGPDGPKPAEGPIELGDGVQSSTAGPPVLVNPTPPNQAAMATSSADASGGSLVTFGDDVRSTYCVYKNFTWNTRAAQGTLIGVVRLGPECNPYIQHISRMYGGWSGSICVRISISGSGIYAGKIMAGVLPPGVNPEEAGQPGAYPHALIDAKTNIAFSVEMYDVRNVEFHYMGDDRTATLALWVYQPLINPFNPADASAMITVETRPGADFNFCMLKSPESVTQTTGPERALPTVLMGSIENRFGRTPTGIVGANIANQVNHHFDGAGVTYGWSTVPFDTPNLHIGQQLNFDNNNIGYMVDPPTGTDPVIPGVPNHWPDSCSSSTINSGANSLAGRGAAGAILTSYQMDVGEQAPYSAQYMVFNQTGAPLGPAIQQGKLAVRRINGTTGSVPQNDGSMCTVSYIMTNNDNNANIGAAVTPLAGVARTYGPLGGNNLCLWYADVPASHRPGGVVHSSQLDVTSTALANGASIPVGSMAVFTVTSAGNVFQIGLCWDGYLRTGIAEGTIVYLDADTRFVYNGLYTVNTPLAGPDGNSGRAFSLLR